MTAETLTYRLDWEGIALSVAFCPDWSPAFSQVYGHALAHLAIETDDGRPLPISDTGFRSLFTAPELIRQAGGPVAFVRAWLDHAATDPAWQDRKARADQLTLF